MSYLFPEPPSETATLPALPTDQGELPPLPSGDGDAQGEPEPVVEDVEPAPPAKRQRTSRSSAKASSSNGGNTYKPIPRLLNLPPPVSPPSHLFPPPSPGSRKARGHDAEEETAGADETETDGLPPLPTASPPPQEPAVAAAPTPAASKPAKGKRNNANAQSRPTPPDALLPPPLHPPPPPGSSVNLYIGRALLANDNWPMKPHDIVGWIKHHHADQWDGDEGRCSAHRVRTYLARKGTDMYYEKLTQGCLTGWRIRQQHLWRFQDGGFQGRGVKQEDFPATQAIANAKILAEAQKHAEEQAAQAHATAAASASTVAAIQAAAAAAANANGNGMKSQMSRQHLQPQQQHSSNDLPALPGHEQGYDYNPLPVSSYSYNPPQQQQQQYAQAYPTYPPQYPQQQQHQQQYQQQYSQYSQQPQQHQQQQQQQHDQQHADNMLAIDPALMGELGRQ